MSISIRDLAREMSHLHGDDIEIAERGVRALAGQIVEIDGEGALDGDDLTEETANVVRETYTSESKWKDAYSAILAAGPTREECIRLTRAEENADISAEPYTEEWYQLVVVAFNELDQP